MINQSSALGMEDVPWLREEISKIAVLKDARVSFARHTGTGVSIHIQWNLMYENDQGVPAGFWIQLEFVRDVLLKLISYFNFYQARRTEELNQYRRAARLRLSDHIDYMNQ